MTKKILFITWDSDKTNYLESLFLPIFHELGKEGEYQWVVLQFSWATQEEIQRLKNLAERWGISFFHQEVNRKRGRVWATLEAIWNGSSLIKKLVLEKGISIVMPRSTLPGWMVNRIYSFLRKNNVKITFDADGFPIQERIEFSGLNPFGTEAQLLKFQEKRIIEKADRVLVRSWRAIEIHQESHGIKSRDKFAVVSNGRDPNQFFFDHTKREVIRNKLGILPAEVCWVYVGSLGPAYAIQEMLALFERVQEKTGNLKFLFLPNDQEYAKQHLISRFQDRLLIQKISFAEVPDYLSAADLGISLRKSAPSLAGLFPIKLGEYLLCGLPVLASLDVGDTRKWLSAQSGIEGVYVGDPEFLEVAEKIVLEEKTVSRPEIRRQALEIFSLAKSVEEYRQALRFLEIMPSEKLAR